MQPHTMIPVPPQSHEPEYRPLSGLAIGSVILASVYAVVVTALGVGAWAAKSPLVLGVWTLVFPAVAAALACCAWFQISRSEGTRSGRGLATAGFWLSIVFGLGYVAFY